MSYQIELEYRDRLNTIKTSQIPTKIKILLLENLTAEMKYMMDSLKYTQSSKNKTFSEVLSTSISECQSVNYVNQKDIEELQEKIIKLRLVKIQNNDEVQTMEEELFEMEKVVRARMEYNEYLKKKIDTKMQELQSSSGQKPEKQKQKSVLNKSLGTVAQILNISKWWN